MDMIVETTSSRTKGGARQKKIVDEAGINGEKLAQVEKESTTCCLEMNHGLLVEVLKKFMFTMEKAPESV